MKSATNEGAAYVTGHDRERVHRAITCRYGGVGIGDYDAYRQRVALVALRVQGGGATRAQGGVGVYILRLAAIWRAAIIHAVARDPVASGVNSDSRVYRLELVRLWGDSMASVGHSSDIGSRAQGGADIPLGDGVNRFWLCRDCWRAAAISFGRNGASRIQMRRAMSEWGTEDFRSRLAYAAIVGAMATLYNLGGDFQSGKLTVRMVVYRATSLPLLIWLSAVIAGRMGLQDELASMVTVVLFLVSRNGLEYLARALAFKWAGVPMRERDKADE